MMEQVTGWVVATRTDNGGPWHLSFSKDIFITYEEAAVRAFELNEGPGYLHKPVKVTIKEEVG